MGGASILMMIFRERQFSKVRASYLFVFFFFWLFNDHFLTQRWKMVQRRRRRSLRSLHISSLSEDSSKTVDNFPTKLPLFHSFIHPFIYFACWVFQFPEHTSNIENWEWHPDRRVKVRAFDAFLAASSPFLRLPFRAFSTPPFPMLK